MVQVKGSKQIFQKVKEKRRYSEILQQVKDFPQCKDELELQFDQLQDFLQIIGEYEKGQGSKDDFSGCLKIKIRDMPATQAAKAMEGQSYKIRANYVCKVPKFKTFDDLNTTYYPSALGEEVNSFDHLKYGLEREIDLFGADIEAISKVATESRSRGATYSSLWELRKEIGTNVSNVQREALFHYMASQLHTDFKPTRAIWAEYAADVPGTGFPCEPTKDNVFHKNPANLNYLPSSDGSLLRHVPQVDGVNRSMMYLGEFGSVFCYHTEDQELFSINYHHDGAPKVWYVVPPKYAAKFELAMLDTLLNDPIRSLVKDGESISRVFGTVAKSFKSKAVFPSLASLQKCGVPVRRIVQQAGEYVVTFPRSYHGGFSLGVNIGEAVNFGLVSWMPYGVASQIRNKHLSGLRFGYNELMNMDCIMAKEALCWEKNGWWQSLCGREDCSESNVKRRPTLRDVKTFSYSFRQWFFEFRNDLERFSKHYTSVAMVPPQASDMYGIQCCNCRRLQYLSYVQFSVPKVLTMGTDDSNDEDEDDDDDDNYVPRSFRDQDTPKRTVNLCLRCAVEDPEGKIESITLRKEELDSCLKLYRGLVQQVVQAGCDIDKEHLPDDKFFNQQSVASSLSLLELGCKELSDKHKKQKKSQNHEIDYTLICRILQEQRQKSRLSAQESCTNKALGQQKLVGNLPGQHPAHSENNPNASTPDMLGLPSAHQTKVILTPLGRVDSQVGQSGAQPQHGMSQYPQPQYTRPVASNPAHSLQGRVVCKDKFKQCMVALKCLIGRTDVQTAIDTCKDLNVFQTKDMSTPKSAMDGPSVDVDELCWSSNKKRKRRSHKAQPPRFYSNTPYMQQYTAQASMWMRELLARPDFGPTSSTFDEEAPALPVWGKKRQRSQYARHLEQTGERLIHESQNDKTARPRGGSLDAMDVDRSRACSPPCAGSHGVSICIEKIGGDSGDDKLKYGCQSASPTQGSSAMTHLPNITPAVPGGLANSCALNRVKITDTQSLTRMKGSSQQYCNTQADCFGTQVSVHLTPSKPRAAKVTRCPAGPAKQQGKKRRRRGTKGSEAPSPVLQRVAVQKVGAPDTLLDVKMQFKLEEPRTTRVSRSSIGASDKAFELSHVPMQMREELGHTRPCFLTTVNIKQD